MANQHPDILSNKSSGYLGAKFSDQLDVRKYANAVLRAVGKNIFGVEVPIQSAEYLSLTIDRRSDHRIIFRIGGDNRYRRHRSRWDDQPHRLHCLHVRVDAGVVESVQACTRGYRITRDSSRMRNGERIKT